MSEQSPDVLEPVVFSYINGVGNHERKTLISALFIQRAGEFITAAQMAHDVNALQGDPPLAWELKPTAVIQNCEKSLMPVGAVISGRARGSSGKEVAAWRAKTENIATHEAMASFLSDWSLRWQDISVQQFYGATSSRGQVRSPQVRHRIYEVLAGSSDGDSIANIGKRLADIGYSQPNSLSAQFAVLADEGIIDKFSKRKDYDPLVKVINTEYRHHFIRLEDAIPETRAIYKVMEKLGTDATASVNELVDMAVALDPRVDNIKLRLLITHGLHSATPNFPGLQIAGDRQIPEDEFSNVRLSSAARQPAEELVEGVAGIVSGKDQSKRAERLREIITQPSDFRALIAKASRFSPYRAGHFHGSQKLMSQIKSLINAKGAATSAEIRQGLIDTYNRKLTQHMVTHALTSLASEGSINMTETTPHAHSTRTLNLYYVS